MKKTFFPLSTDDTSVSDAHKITTWQAPSYTNRKNPEQLEVEPCCEKIQDKRCKKPKEKLKPVDEISMMYRKLAKKDKKGSLVQPLKPKCLKLDKYTECVHIQKTSSQQKAQAIIREKAIRIKEKLKEVRHDAQEPPKYLKEGKSLIKLDSPTLGGDGEKKPSKASQTCSENLVYVQPRRLLDLKPPRSGIFLNEEKLPSDTSIPFDTYNPRLLQPKADQIVPHRLIERDDRLFVRLHEEEEVCDEEEGEDFWDNWEPKERLCTEPCCCLFFKQTFDDANEFEECLHNFPKIFKIPEDLERWFTATAILGSTRCSREKEKVKKEEDRRRRKSLAALYTAFFHTYSDAVIEWEPDTIDEIVEEAEELQEKSTEWYYQDESGDFDIIPEDLEKGMTLKLERIYTGALNCFDPNIMKALYLFFQNGQTCIVQCKTLYLLIWRMCDHFWIFDPNARTENCERNWLKGKAALIKTKPLEHVVHIILNLSDLEPVDMYNLYEVRLVNFGTIQSPIETNASARKRKLFLVVNKYYAIIPATTGMDPPEDAEDFNKSLLVSLFGLIYAKMDPPRHWPRKVIDNIIKFGERYARKYLKVNKLDSLNGRNLPTELYMGSYRIDVEIIPFLVTGHLSECTNYRFSTLTSCILQLFRDHKGALLQIDTSAVAIWRDADFYYVFDPFRRGPVGQYIDIDEDSGNAILQMHITLESICRMLYKNALGMMSNGIFLIHPVKIKSISYMSRIQSQLGKGHDFLKITFPIQCDVELGNKEVVSCSDIKEPAKKLPANVQNDCLSILSLSPCQRTCSEADVYEQEKKEKAKLKKAEILKHADSLESLEDADKIPEDDTGDIVFPVLEHIICLVMVELAARARGPVKEPVKAKKVLLKTDRGHLESLKVRVKRGQDYDNIYAEFPTEKGDEHMISLKDELLLPSNFTPLPDGGEVVFGNSESEFNEEENLLTGMLAAIAASVIARKYKISTWNSAIVDYAMETGKILQEAYEPPKDLLSLLVTKQIPKVQLGSKTYRVVVLKTDIGNAEDLSSILEKSLSRSKFLILLFNSFSCAVFRRCNFFYLFMGFPCDFMGFRSAHSGNPCLLRFHDYNAFVQRIDFNRLVASAGQRFIVLSVHVKNISPDKDFRFPPYSPSLEELVYQRELTEKQKADKKIAEKMAFLDDELRKENERIRLFQEEKEAAKGKEQKTKKKRRGRYVRDEEEEFEEEESEEDEGEGEEVEEEEEEEEEVEKKHKPGRKLSKIEPSYDDKEKEELELGYRLRETDLLFKIQGTNSMESRSGGSPKVIRACYFAGVYAIIYAILRPLNKWEFRRIDQVIENANELFEVISDKSTACDRKIDNLRADEYLFNLTVRVTTSTLYGGIKLIGFDISGALNKISKQKQYFLVQISNCTFAVYKDQYWHLFDPYKTLEEIGGMEEGEEEEDEKEEVVIPKGIQKYPDRNTASWVLFPNMDTMLEYISKRAESEKWRTQYRIHIVDIRSFRKAPKQTKMVHFLLADGYDREKEIFENIACLPEEVRWLEGEIPPWSRTIDENIVGDKRGTNLSLWKNFDIEVPKELFSLWGSLHPLAPVFKKSRGKQYLATNIIACCMASLYRVTEWNAKVIDNIVIHGDKYFNDSTEGIRITEYEFSLEDLNTEYEMNHIHWDIHLESVLYGTLYSKKKGEFNLSSALIYFFSNYRFGVIQCLNRSLAFGRANKGYFLFDCQNYGPPLFKKSEGTAYILLSMTLKKLLYCMIMTLRIPYYNMDFVIHKVEVSASKSGQEEEEGTEEPGTEPGPAIEAEPAKSKQRSLPFRLPKLHSKK